MNNLSLGLFVGLISASFLFFVCYVVFSNLIYKKKYEESYDFRNHFPYEYNFNQGFKENILGNICLILSMLLSMGSYGLALGYFFNNGNLLFVVISGIIFSIAVLFANFVPLKLLRFHVISAIISFVAAFATPSAIALAAFANYRETSSSFSMVILVTSIVVAVFFFGAVMNPRLTLKIQMIVEKDTNGNEKYVRPKFIVFALSEWFVNFGIIVSDLLFLFLIISLVK